MTPLHRSRAFRWGLAVLVVIAGMWISSAFWYWSVNCGRGRTLILGSGAHRITLMWSRDESISPGTSWLLTESGRCGGDNPVFPKLESEFFHIEIVPGKFYTGGTHVIPYWLVLVVVTGLWLVLLSWRRRRQRKLAAAVAMPDVLAE
jgi:hypothetical protein